MSFAAAESGENFCGRVPVARRPKRMVKRETSASSPRSWEAAVAVAKDAAANPVVRPANLVTKAEGYTLALSTRSWGVWGWG